MFVALYSSLPLAASGREVSVRQLNSLPFGTEFGFTVAGNLLLVHCFFSSWRTLGVKIPRKIGSLDIYEHLRIAELIDAGYHVKLRLNGKDRYATDGMDLISLRVSVWARQADILSVERIRLLNERSEHEFSGSTISEIGDLNFGSMSVPAVQTALQSDL